MQEQEMRSRLFAQAELCGAAVEIGGQRLEPDQTKAYVEFKLAHSWPSRTVYGTSFHAGTVANSYVSMLHQVFNWGHKMRSYDTSKERKDIPRDYMLGSIVAVEYPRMPPGGWSMQVGKDAAGNLQVPGIRAAAVIHKQAEKVPQTLGEHLGGRHTWTVSLEVGYSLLQSGFLVGERAKAKKAQETLMADTTPNDIGAMGMGYVTVEEAPEELLNTLDLKKRSIVSTWEGLPVTLLKGGINGQVHFQGVGMVRYGAEREAEIQTLLATDPEKLTEDGPGDEGLTAGQEAVLAYFRMVAGK
jgi:hypothetical protein